SRAKPSRLSVLPTVGDGRSGQGNAPLHGGILCASIHAKITTRGALAMTGAKSRDESPKPVRDRDAARGSCHCSKPRRDIVTSGPAEDPAQSFSIGTAAHITAALRSGPRYDRSLTPTQRTSTGNAIWLCRNCGTLVDRDPGFLTAAMLRDWKQQAENRALI